MIQFLPGIQQTSSALNAERVRLEVISQNIANANVTRAADGQPYQRQQVVFQTILDQAAQSAGNGGVRIARVDKDTRPFTLVYNPGHPDADPSGMVKMPNVNVHEEMADLISASRSFEANLAVIKNARAMAIQTLSIGKRG